MEDVTDKVFRRLVCDRGDPIAIDDEATANAETPDEVDAAFPSVDVRLYPIQGTLQHPA